MVVKGKTKTGFEYEIDKDIFDDMQFVDLIADADDGNPLAMTKLLTFMLKDQKKALYDHLRDDKGRIPIERTGEEIADIFTNLSESEKK